MDCYILKSMCPKTQLTLWSKGNARRRIVQRTHGFFIGHDPLYWSRDQIAGHVTNLLITWPRTMLYNGEKVPGNAELGGVNCTRSRKSLTGALCQLQIRLRGIPFSLAFYWEMVTMATSADTQQTMVRRNVRIFDKSPTFSFRSTPN